MKRMMLFAYRFSFVVAAALCFVTNANAEQIDLTTGGAGHWNGTIWTQGDAPGWTTTATANQLVYTKDSSPTTSVTSSYYTFWPYSVSGDFVATVDVSRFTTIAGTSLNSTFFVSINGFSLSIIHI